MPGMKILFFHGYRIPLPLESNSKSTRGTTCGTNQKSNAGSGLGPASISIPVPTYLQR